MVKMRKIQKVFMGILAAGVLIAGIGTGTALIEYSTLRFGGEKIIGEENLITKTLEYHLEDENQEILLRRMYSYDFHGNMEVLEEADVPEHVIQYEVTYNEEKVRPFLWDDEWEQSESEEEKGAMLRIGLEYLTDDFQTFMECKDQILDDLKEKTISSYRTSYVTSVIVKINPKTMEQVEVEH